MLDESVALRLLLIADAGVSALVSTRIYPGILEQTVTLPAIAYRRVNEEPEIRLESRGSAGLQLSRWRFFATANGNGAYVAATAIDEAVRLAIHGYSGTVDDGLSPSVDSLEIHGIFKENAFDIYDDTTKTHQVVADYAVWSVQEQP